MSSSRILSILRSMKELKDPVRVQGAPASARAFILARWAMESNTPITVLCPNDDVADDLATDVETLSGIILGKQIETLVFPNWEQSPYSPIAPSIKIRQARVAALSSITNGNPKLIITTLSGACRATIPRRVLDEYTQALTVEQSVESRDRLIRKLIEAGYQRVDTVEDAGTFASRGDIVDVFPPAAESPLRIELFGDVIERIREFEPSTQRTSPANEGSLPSVRIPPAREVLINVNTGPLLRERLKAWADDAGISRATRDPLLAAIQEGQYPEHSDTWAPFAYEQPASLWDYLLNTWPIVWDDELSILQEWDTALSEQKKLFEESVAALRTANRPSENLVPGIAELFQWNPNREKDVRDRTRLYLDRVELGVNTAEEEPSTPEEKEENPVSARHRVFIKTNAEFLATARHSLADLEPKFGLWLKQGYAVAVVASTQSQAERIRFLLEEHRLACRIDGRAEPKIVTLSVNSLSEGFRWPAEGVVVLTESEILGARHTRKQKRSKKKDSAAKEWSGLQALSDLAVGDAVVHIDHGIGRYLGLARLDLSGAPSDFLLIEYANRDKLYVPVYRLNVIQKYVGAGEAVALDRLGTQHFAKEKDRVKDAVKKLAIDLVQLYAERKIHPGIRFSGRDSAFREFEAQFPFEETPDQVKAIDDCLGDLESGKVMDRIVCGDVGYGKTEVAMRAAYRAVSEGKQVAVLVPTTVLAHQHELTFKGRFKDYPIIIESISRFKSAKQQKATVAALASGKIDIVIGTHRLLSKDIKFSDLGLVIVDEEHRFGVEHKERLKTLRINTHVLTLTATPIPRTLHMALAGLRDISLINTPPVDRLPIRTYVSKFDEALIKRAVEFELARGGQVFFLHNRTQTIYETAERVQQIVPQAKVVVGHGQMSEGALEKAMVTFYQKEANVLVCTTIIESGLDLPSANTIVIDRADALGLAQLYQIRGRVGRSQQRAYAYLLLPETAITDEAKRRIEVIQRFVELGSGFSIASHDLEIRGGGDLLGPQQSGHIAAVGFDLYTELLDEAIRELKGKPLTPEESRREPEIKAPFPAFLSEDYVPDVHQRLSLYRRFSAAAQDSELDAMEEELRDRFGPLPAEAQNLIWLIRVKQLLKRIGVDSLTVGPERISLVPGPQSLLDPVRAIALVSAYRSKYQLTPDSKFVATVPTGSLRDLFFSLESLFRDLMPK